MHPLVARVSWRTALLFASCASSFAQGTTLVSVSSTGIQGNGFSGGPALSADGRYVLFASEATNLVAGDTNGVPDMFLRDRTAGTTVRVSVSSSGGQGNGSSPEGALSADGRFVAFTSDASNLVPGDTNAHLDVFVHDRLAGTTARISVTSGGAQASGRSEGPAISADGRFVVFDSKAPDLVAGDTNGYGDVFVHDRQTGITSRASVDSSGAQGDLGAYDGALSADGRFVGFASDSTSLVAGDTNLLADVFVHDRLTGTTERVSVATGGAEPDSDCGFPVLSADGRFVAFESAASTLVTSDTNGWHDVFVRDRLASTTVRVSVDSSGNEGNDASGEPFLSADGRFVAFFTLATNLVAGDLNGVPDVCVHDRATGATTRESVGPGGAEANETSATASLSPDGRHVVFTSGASNLVAGDTNSDYDVFLRERWPAGPVAYCTAGTTTHGCVPWIAGSGTPSASVGAGFTVTVSALEGQKQGLLFYGIDNAGFVPTAWGASSSWLCVKPPTQRTPVQGSGGTAGLCDGTLALDWNAYIAANPGVLGSPFAAGQHVWSQGWFRDPPSPKSTQLSNALEFEVGP